MIPIEKYQDDLLVKLNLYVKEQLGFTVEFVNKEMDMGFLETDLPLLETPANNKEKILETLDKKYINSFNVNYLAELDTYDDKKVYFELFCCKVIFPEPIYIIEEFTMEGRKDLLYKAENVIEAFRHIQVSEYNKDGTEKKTPFIQKWMKDETMRVCQHMIFKPMNCIGRPVQIGED
jgi:hypothetical protein